MPDAKEVDFFLSRLGNDDEELTVEAALATQNEIAELEPLDGVLGKSDKSNPNILLQFVVSPREWNALNDIVARGLDPRAKHNKADYCRDFIAKGIQRVLKDYDDGVYAKAHLAKSTRQKAMMICEFINEQKEICRTFEQAVHNSEDVETLAQLRIQIKESIVNGGFSSKNKEKLQRLLDSIDGG